MFRISAQMEYGYVALIRLARDYGAKTSTKLSEITAPANLSEKFMLQVLTELRRAGLVQSRRGKTGGYTLAMPPERITLADLFTATVGEGDEENRQFSISGPESCLAGAVRSFHSSFLSRMKTISLQDALMEETRSGATMYYI